MKPATRANLLIPNDVNKIHVLESGQKTWDIIRDLVSSGIQDSFYILDVGDIVRKHNEWKLKMPRVTAFYAVKCNDTHFVLATLVSLGASFDCASQVEIAKVLDLGVVPDRIIYSNPVKQESHIQYAASVNVQKMTFDNEEELYKIKEHFPSAKVILRIRCDAKNAQFSLGTKFGALPKLAPGLIDLALRLGLDLIGISFHVGSSCYESEVFERCVKIGRQMFDLAEREHHIKLKILDLGGGFPGNGDPSFDDMVTVINSSLDLYFPEGCGVDIIAEPGRYYVESAFTLATRIHGRRRNSNTDAGGAENNAENSETYDYYINDGVYSSFMTTLVGCELPPQLLEHRTGPCFNSNIWGPTCDALDCVSKNIQLPLMNIDDWFIFENMGAYTLACSTFFNGFPVSKIYSVSQKETWQYLKDYLPFDDSHLAMSEVNLGRNGSEASDQF